jgi:hypothetical protein
VKIAFHSFSDIGNPHTYIPPDESRLLQVKVKKSDSSKFNFTEWWKVREGEILREPFDVGDEVTAALLRAVEMVGAFIHFPVQYSNHRYSSKLGPSFVLR